MCYSHKGVTLVPPQAKGRNPQGSCHLLWLPTHYLKETLQENPKWMWAPISHLETLVQAGLAFCSGRPCSPTTPCGPWHYLQHTVSPGMWCPGQGLSFFLSLRAEAGLQCTEEGLGWGTQSNFLHIFPFLLLLDKVPGTKPSRPHTHCTLLCAAITCHSSGVLCELCRSPGNGVGGLGLRGSGSPQKRTVGREGAWKATWEGQDAAWDVCPPQQRPWDLPLEESQQAAFWMSTWGCGSGPD